MILRSLSKYRDTGLLLLRILIGLLIGNRFLWEGDGKQVVLVKGVFS